tara:strand:- start:3413 stop:4066 length:654 start_codon:yes stop_codon:yes gene_type:complete
MQPSGEGLSSRDWRQRLGVSRDLGTGFAAPGGEFTRALFEWSLLPGGRFLHALLHGRRVVELGAGMMPYGYAFAAHAGAKNFVAVEPFYADRQEISQAYYVEETLNPDLRIPRKVESRDMLAYLQDEPDDLLTILACGIEDCILPGPDYKKKVEGEIERTLQEDAFFLSSHSDLKPQGLINIELVFKRPSHPNLIDRLRLHGKKSAFEKWQDIIPAW